ncbi:hypothetical protein ACSHT0_08010 [Tepidicaulis sp. LMO-SS28]|uniref:hypothetical protein n=1 Tax=Tepidicaulis sp. LMO-SS28 TaxID=3447455 RepID=UPI003EE04C73
MAEIRTVTTLTRKRRQIEASIAAYERRLEQARIDLAHITAAISIFEASGEPSDLLPYADIHRIYKRGEITKICKEALAQEGPLDTRQLAKRVLAAKGLDQNDSVLSRAMCMRIVHSLRMQHKRGKMGQKGKRKGVWVWELNGA